MAIDSEAKRKSIAALGPPTNAPVVVPSGTISAQVRQVVAWSYYGIAAASPGGIAFPVLSDETIHHAVFGGLTVR